MNSSNLESGLSTALQNAQDAARRQFDTYQENVRQAPGPSLLYAALFGYIFRLLPIGALLGALLSLILTLAKPAILVFGAMKLFETLKRDEGAV
jgi:hypothetical protein